MLAPRAGQLEFENLLYGAPLMGWLTLTSFQSSLRAQGVATARISGTLTDESGAVLLGAAVQAEGALPLRNCRPDFAK
jgi:hypothetical protein